MATPTPTPTPTTDLAGKIAIITGASRGIGEGIAFELARRGAKVVITYTSPRSAQPVQDLITRITALNNGSEATSVKADLRLPDSPARIIEATKEAFGGEEDAQEGEGSQFQIDILVNNAGVEVVKPLSDLTIQDFDSVFELNVRAAVLMTQAVLPYLPKPSPSPSKPNNSNPSTTTAAADNNTSPPAYTGARIINIGSVASRAAFPSLSLYCASKAALEGLTRCWAVELGGDGHTVNIVNPGPVQSELLDKIPSHIVDMQKANTPVQNRVGSVDDVVQVVAWLAGEGSRWVSGQAISASGGWAMY